jgi:hypothetical protein
MLLDKDKMDFRKLLYGIHLAQKGMVAEVAVTMAVNVLKLQEMQQILAVAVVLDT